MKTTIVQSNPCPVCKTNLNATSHRDAAPKPGDVSICFYCTTVLEFNNDLLTIQLTDEKFSKLPKSVKLEVLNYLKEIMKLRRRLETV